MVFAGYGSPPMMAPVAPPLSAPTTVPGEVPAPSSNAAPSAVTQALYQANPSTVSTTAPAPGTIAGYTYVQALDPTR